MLIDELRAQCERWLTGPYTITVKHYRHVASGYVYTVDVSQDGGGIVSASHAVVGASVRAASNALQIWATTFGSRPIDG
jgi:hypothetical protein